MKSENSMRIRLSSITFVVLSFVTTLALHPVNASGRLLSATGNGGWVSTGHPEATAAAIRVLKTGGNAVDAAIAAAFVLSVADPSNSGIGGDGFALIHLPSGMTKGYDASAPRPTNHKPGTCKIGLPTVPELFRTLLERHGSRNLSEIAEPAVTLARRGFPISAELAAVVMDRITVMHDPEAIRLFAPEGRPLQPGEILVQHRLADTLEKIATEGLESFYSGNLANTIFTEMTSKGAYYSRNDLKSYRCKSVHPVILNLGDWTLIGAPPPSSSVVVMNMISELCELPSLNLFNPSPDVLETVARHILLKKRYLAAAVRNPRLFFAHAKNTRSFTKLFEEVPTDPDAENQHTTHMVVWDKHGMIVSMTLTLGFHFGSYDYSSLGFFYNNQMNNFKPGITQYPLDYPEMAGPISAKAPLIMLKNGIPALAIGGAGANRIVSNLGLIGAAVIRGEMDLQKAIHAPRFFPDIGSKLIMEWHPSRDPENIASYAPMQVIIKPAGDDFFGLVSAVGHFNSAKIAVGDYRRDGSAGALDTGTDPDNILH